ncbi:Panacea domain-containing protein [Alkalibacillus sp. S2W]|uniref:Panacea domain-containing protein n=1 Tax=Alkalibacillus sp. S2W TaxID=3386553 RepID=UPI00398D24F0
MAKAMEVAKFLLYLKEHDPRGLKLSNLKLQKLLYYSHGYYLALHNKLLIHDRFLEAWKYGPVIPDIYHNFNSFGSGDIKINDNSLGKIELNDIEKSIIAYVWKEYGEFTGGQLIDKSHSESPWLNAFTENKNNIIENKDIEKYFNKNMSNKLIT